ncbi:MAG: tRNA pseudouridine(55) synthase TruB, partial [Clostridia bacterium]|nr:tRNA pseudouridine(55) synthase TruB [Clostridia bacterium]
RCSKGTYVRSIIHDLGKLLGCGAAMSSLVRTESCGFTLDDCVTLDQLQAARDENEPERWLKPVETAFVQMPRRDLPHDRLRPFLNGLPTRTGKSHAVGTYAVWYDGQFLGLGEQREDGQFYPKKFFVNIEALRAQR